MYRLHDLRSPKPYEMMYVDIADQNPVYCIHPFGHDRFVVGAGGDAVVKIFDLRIPTLYHRATRQQSHPQVNGSSTMSRPKGPTPTPQPSKDLSLFLSFTPASLGYSNPRFARQRYRGPIYAMSSPSLLSPTIYTGVAGGILRLDFASTDDLTGPNNAWYRDAIDLSPKQQTKESYLSDPIDLSGYERPDSRDTTTCSKLRSQTPFEFVNDKTIENEHETGWDRRWNPPDAPGAWRRRDL